MKHLFQALERVLFDLEIDFYLIGAQARDVWASIYNLSNQRLTKDVDIAVFVPNKARFDLLRDRLIATGQFKAALNNDVKFIFQENTEIDIIPFGGVDLFAGERISDLAAYAALPDNGFKEVYEESTQLLEFEDNIKFKVCKLPGIVILKLLAYDNSPDRLKDLEDIYHIIISYFDVVADDIYENHLDLFDNEVNFKMEMVGARVLGRHIKPILQRNERLQKRIEGFLERAITLGEDSKLIQYMSLNKDKSLDYISQLLKVLLQGIRD